MQKKDRERGGGGEREGRIQKNSEVVGLALGFLCLVYAPLQQTDKKRRASRPTEFLDSAVGWWSLTKRRMVCGDGGSALRGGERGGGSQAGQVVGVAGLNGSHSA